MKKNKPMLEGQEYALWALECPSCGNLERTPIGEQKREFELAKISESGLHRVWLCRKCNVKFHTQIGEE